MACGRDDCSINIIVYVTTISGVLGEQNSPGVTHRCLGSQDHSVALRAGQAWLAAHCNTTAVPVAAAGATPAATAGAEAGARTVAECGRRTAAAGLARWTAGVAADGVHVGARCAYAPEVRGMMRAQAQEAQERAQAPVPGRVACLWRRAYASV